MAFRGYQGHQGQGSGGSSRSAGEALNRMRPMVPGHSPNRRPPPPLTYTAPIGSQGMGVIPEASPRASQVTFTDMSPPPPALLHGGGYGYNVTNTGTPRHQASPMFPQAGMAMPASPMRSDAELVSTPGGARTPGARTGMPYTMMGGSSPGMPLMSGPSLPYTPGSPASPMRQQPTRLTWGTAEQHMLQMGRTRLVGMQQAPLAGLRVVLSEQGQQVLANDDLGPKLSRGKPGVISKVHPEGDACMVLWDIVRKEDGGESGWYRCGAYGQYTLQMTDYANSEGEILSRQEQLRNHTINVFEPGFT